LVVIPPRAADTNDPVMRVGAAPAVDGFINVLSAVAPTAPAPNRSTVRRLRFGIAPSCPIRHFFG
jgi:hypothetical protein